MALISLEHVSKVYPKGTRPALDDINLDINRGDFVFPRGRFRFRQNHIAEPVAARGGGHGWRDSRRR